MHLRGVNHSGFEYVIDGDWRGSGTWQERVQQNLDTMKSWGVNCVRLPIQKKWWETEPTYKTNIDFVIAEAKARQIYVVIDYQWYDSVTQLPIYEAYTDTMKSEWQVMWVDIAGRYKDQVHVLFDLFNEPHSSSWYTWQIWAVDMQKCINAIRAIADNLIIIDAMNSLSQGLEQYEAHIWGGKNLVASGHAYVLGTAKTVEEMATQLTSLHYDLSQTTPVLIGECGINDFTPDNIQQFASLLSVANAWGMNYLAWNWSTRAVMGYPLLDTYFSLSTGGQILIDAIQSQMTYTLVIQPSTNGTTTPPQGTYIFTQGEPATITAQPSTGYSFDHWELDGISVSTASSY